MSKKFSYMERSCPVIPANAAYMEGKKDRLSLFLPNPFWTIIGCATAGLVIFVFFLITLRSFLLTSELNSHGKRANGVVNFAETYSRKSGRAYRITYSYTVEGITRTRTDDEISIDTAAGIAEKSPVPVVYSANDPSKARLGTPGHLWGQPRGLEGMILGFTLMGALAMGYFAVKAYREISLHRLLDKTGQIVLAEAISSAAEKGYRGKFNTEIVYRVPVEDGSVIGRATYVTQSEGVVRRPRAGEKIPVLFCSAEAHRPL